MGLEFVVQTADGSAVPIAARRPFQPVRRTPQMSDEPETPDTDDDPSQGANPNTDDPANQPQVSDAQQDNPETGGTDVHTETQTVVEQQVAPGAPGPNEAPAPGSPEDPLTHPDDGGSSSADTTSPSIPTP